MEFNVTNITWFETEFESTVCAPLPPKPKRQYNMRNVNPKTPYKTFSTTSFMYIICQTKCI